MEVIRGEKNAFDFYRKDSQRFSQRFAKIYAFKDFFFT